MIKMIHIYAFSSQQLVIKQPDDIYVVWGTKQIRLYQPLR